MKKFLAIVALVYLGCCIMRAGHQVSVSIDKLTAAVKSEGYGK